jgi:hypothetical protein
MTGTALRAFREENPSALAAIPAVPSSATVTESSLSGEQTAAVPDLANWSSSAGDLSVNMAAVSRIAAASITDIESPKNQVVAEWHGMVTELLESNFVAELQGILGVGVRGAIEEAVIPIDEVREEDRGLLEPGAFFRLCVNNAIRSDGKTRRRFTDVVFRRLPAYRRDELEEAAERGRAIARAIRVE